MSVDRLTHCELAAAQTDYVACNAYVEQNEDGLTVTQTCPKTRTSMINVLHPTFGIHHVGLHWVITSVPMPMPRDNANAAGGMWKREKVCRDFLD